MAVRAWNSSLLYSFHAFYSDNAKVALLVEKYVAAVAGLLIRGFRACPFSGSEAERMR